jgi:integrase
MLSIYLYLRKGYIYCRIKDNKTTKTISTGIRCAKDDFIQSHQITNNPEINYKINYWRSESVKCDSIEQFVKIINSKVHLISLTELVDYYCRRPDLSLGSIEKYQALKNIIKKFNDLKIDLVNNQYAIDFFNYCRSWMTQNSAIQRLKQLKMIINYAVDLEMLDKNPIKYSPKKEVKPIIYLTIEELEKIYKKDLVGRLEVVRDIFIFCCYTGLEYSRVFDLTPDQIKSDGKRYWIESVRQKTGKYANPRLLPIPLKLIEKYNGGSKCFPVRSNVKMNAYLKEIADICGIDKKLHTHLARHTFATTICLANGVSAESTAKMMGITLPMLLKKYGQIIDKRVWDDTDELFKKFD